MATKKLKPLQKNEFETIYNRFFHIYYDIAQRFLYQEEDAKSVVQDAFIKLWENEIHLQNDDEIKNYLFILVRNRSLNVIRQRKKQFQTTDQPEYLINSISHKLLEKTGEDILLYQELFEKVQQAIQALSPQCKKVFQLSRFEDLSNKEIAAVLDISVKAVEANITRALKQLREELAPYLISKEAAPKLPVLFYLSLS